MNNIVELHYMGFVVTALKWHTFKAKNKLKNKHSNIALPDALCRAKSALFSVWEKHCVYSSCVRGPILHVNETWPLTKPNLQCLQQYDRAMIRQICNVKPQDTATIRSTELLAQLGIKTWTSSWRSEGSAGMDTWNTPTVRSRHFGTICPLGYILD